MSLPSPHAVRSMLAEVLDREITIKPGPPYAPSVGSPASIAVYVDDSLRICAVVAVDLPLSAYLAACIGLVPVGGTEESLEARALSPALTENLFEVMNIAITLFNRPGEPHVRLYALHAVGADVPQDIQARALTLGQREDLEVAVPGYGSGRLSIVMC